MQASISSGNISEMACRDLLNPRGREHEDSTKPAGCFFRWRHAVQGQVPAPDARSNGDAVGNGGGLQVIQAGVGHQVQLRVLRIGGGSEKWSACLER